MAVFTKHEGCEKCGSSDAKAVYNDGSTYCWNCTKATLSEEYKELLQDSKPKRKRKDTMVDEQKVQSTKPVIDPEDAAKPTAAFEAATPPRADHVTDDEPTAAQRAEKVLGADDFASADTVAITTSPASADTVAITTSPATDDTVAINTVAKR